MLFAANRALVRLCARPGLVCESSSPFRPLPFLLASGWVECSFSFPPVLLGVVDHSQRVESRLLSFASEFQSWLCRPPPLHAPQEKPQDQPHDKKSCSTPCTSLPLHHRYHHAIAVGASSGRMFPATGAAALAVAVAVLFLLGLGASALAWGIGAPAKPVTRPT